MLVLGKVALALLVAVPAIVAVAIVLGVVLVRVAGSPRRAGVPLASGTVPADWPAYRSRLRHRRDGLSAATRLSEAARLATRS